MSKKQEMMEKRITGVFPLKPLLFLHFLLVSQTSFAYPRASHRMLPMQQHWHHGPSCPPLREASSHTLEVSQTPSNSHSLSIESESQDMVTMLQITTSVGLSSHGDGQQRLLA
eukprot:TRINITY_DN18344_c0_g1_i1.p1 TRINITY_DN18344_c0_g1~~TRINITY_DN18344_c0_g1_i1.p1  ORF type:complete len:113 (+),score=9.83 TRINITY_DN18344_c0_g1_i1:139-477(+)